MNSRVNESQLNLINEFKQNRPALIAYSIDNGKASKTREQFKNSYIQNLLAMPVTKLSRFADEKWDYNEDIPNSPRNVRGAKLKIDFSEYAHIPTFVMIELKCLLHCINLVPAAFGQKRLKKNQNKKIARKPNTIIAHFKAGLRYFDHLFAMLRLDGDESVDSRYKTITSILESNFEDAASNFPFKVDKTLDKFFYYLKHPETKKILDADIEIDFQALNWPEQQNNVRNERLVFSNDDFEKLVSHASTTVVNFLVELEVEIEDKNVLKHLDASALQENINLSQDLLSDYTLIRLLAKGYSETYISNLLEIDSTFYNSSGNLLVHESVRKIVKAKHRVDHFDDVRRYINKVYYASSLLVGMFTGMRPNALSEIRLTEQCLIVEDGIDLLVSEDKKGRNLRFNLFDDKWVAIPIVKDAIKAAKIIAQLKANTYLFSNSDTVAAGSPMTNMASTGITHMINSYLCVVLGEERAKQIRFNPYMFRHTLAYQLFRADLGLPFISFQLKHIVNSVEKYTNKGASSATSIGYGEIAQKLSSNDRKAKSIRQLAEIERVKSVMDPDSTYLGPKGEEHKRRLKKAFEGYMAAGYSKEDVFSEMAEQGIAIVNVGTGFCYGGVEDFDESLPCIGALRCNPIRCSNAVVSKANAPKWREVYFANKALLGKDGYEDKQSQIMEAINEAAAVLKHLGEEVIS